MTLLLQLALAWIGFLLLWLLFVFRVTSSELFVGAVASSITVVLAHITQRVVPACFKPRVRWIAQAWRLPTMIAIDLWLLLKHLLQEIIRKPSLSSFQVIRFKATGKDCYASAQRALAILFVSTSPNSVVLDIDREKQEMLFHQLEPAAAPELLRKVDD